MDYLRALFGLLVFIGIGFALSSSRKSIDWRLIGSGILLQIVFGVLIAEISWFQAGFQWVSEKFVTFLSFASKGTEFLVGDLAKNSEVDPTAKHSLGFLFAFQALPIVIFFSAVTSALYYVGVLQLVVKGIAWVMSKTMRLSGAESLSAAGNIFLGQTEAPLLVKPFIKGMTISELNCLMTGGMATIAGSVLGAYVTFLGGGDPAEQARFATYLLSASIMNAPAAIVMSKLFLPELSRDKIDSSLNVSKESMGVNILDAITNGVTDGLKLALNIGAMLLAFIAMIFAINWILVDGIGAVTGLNDFVVRTTNGAFDGFSLQYILGQIFRVFAFLAGVEWGESVQVGSLIGQKFVINEFVAYLGLSEMKMAGSLSDKSIVIATYALCGFANFSSIAIQVGGIGSLAPSRQSDLSRLGLRALLAATFATLMTATIAGALLI